MNVPIKYRGYLYIASAIASVALGVAVALGWVTTGQVDEWVAIGTYALTTVTSILARLNLADPQ
jgi:hypothetical protein